jgi:hypothetical protein
LLAAVSELEAQFAASPSEEVVEKMQRELQILKRLEYNAEHEEPTMLGYDDSRRDHSSEPTSQNGG